MDELSDGPELYFNLLSTLYNCLSCSALPSW